MSILSRPYLEMIKNSVRKENIFFKEIASDYLHHVIKDEKFFVMYDVEIGLNNSSSSKLATSKSATFDVLNQANIPAVEHFFLINNESRFCKTDPFAAAHELFTKFGKNVVLKPDNGRQGHHVFLINKTSQLKEKLHFLYSIGNNAALSPYYDSALEYRVVILCGIPRIFLAKEKRNSWKHNLVNGAMPKEVDSEKIPMLAELAKQSATALQLEFCSVDILETAAGLKILEVNEQVMLDEYLKKTSYNQKAVSELYRDAILQRFKNL